jgi:tetratricopeptide (TPR) repeat protein
MTLKNTTKRILTVLGIVLSIALFNSCVTVSGTAKPNPKLAAQYLEKGQELEKQGDLTSALEQYKLAMTADPKNDTAIQSNERLSKQLSKLADARYDLGMKYHRQGKYALARKQFLTALKYQPDHPGASRMLVSRQPDKAPQYVLHEIQKGESLSIIAKKYYGDFKKFDVIARYNDLKDATMVKPGQTIKVPILSGSMQTLPEAKSELKSTAFVEHTIAPGQSISKLAQIYYGDYHKFHIIAQYNKMDDATQVKVGDKIRIPKVDGLPFNQPSEGLQQTTEVPVQASAGKKAKQTEASAPESEPDKGAMEVPESLQPEATDKLSDDNNEQILAYRDAGIELYNEGKYEDAIFELNKSVEALPEDQQTRAYLAKAYFESGKTQFNQNDYDAAKEAFESALQFNPNCAECKNYIEKSKSGPLLTYRTKGIDYFNRNEFGKAISAFQQYLQVQPGDTAARTYLSKAYFQKALIDYNKTDYMTAKNGFESALKYDSQCEKCATYINQSLESHKEVHYNKGVTYYGKQQLEEAIREWELVYDLDPGYKNVDPNLKKARALMDKLEQIKKSRQ